MEPCHLSIGKVAALTNISEKRLRYYDVEGLCSPAYRNPVTGYRYYTEDQIPLLMWISYLRALGLPVNSISELLQAGDLSTLKQALDLQVLENQTQLAQAQYRYDQIFELRQRISIALSHIRTKSQPRMISVVHTEPFYNLILSFRKEYANMTTTCLTARFDQLNEQARSLNLVTVGGNALICRKHPFLTGSDPQTPIEIQALLQIKSPPAMLRSDIRRSEGFSAATTTYVGPYEKLYTAYEAIQNWAEANGIQLGTDSLEDHQITSSMTGDAELCVTQLYIPLAGCEL